MSIKKRGKGARIPSVLVPPKEIYTERSWEAIGKFLTISINFYTNKLYP